MDDTKQKVEPKAERSKLPKALEDAIASWENATRQTLGPLQSDAASNAMHECFLTLRPTIAAAFSPKEITK